MADEKTVAEKAKMEEKQKVEAAASTSAAQSVADAVKRVADAAVAEVSKVRVTEGYDFVITGSPGSRFDIRGHGFGAGGNVFVNGKAVNTTGWGATQIEGQLPSDATSGEVIVWIDTKTQQHGYLRV